MSPARAIPITKVPEDVMQVEIVAGLPVKTLLALKLVCKPWCKLIQSREFVDLHHKLAKKYARHDTVLVTAATPEEYPYYTIYKYFMCFLCNDTLTVLRHVQIDVDEEPMDYDFDSYFESLTEIPYGHEPPFFEVSDIAGSCNGLICMAGGGYIVLCNPATREFKTLPQPPFSYSSHLGRYPKSIGFGYDSLSHDYKVIEIIGFRYEQLPVRAEIYNLATNSWRQIDEAVPDYNYGDLGYCFKVYFKGACHWLVWKYEHTYILTFDLEQEMFGRIEVPDPSYTRVCGISVLNDEYLVHFVHFKDHGEGLDIWVMEEYTIKESWTKRFSIVDEYIITIRPLMFWKDKSLLAESPVYLSSHDLETSAIEYKLECPGHVNRVRAIPYTESLVCIKKISYMETVEQFD